MKKSSYKDSNGLIIFILNIIPTINTKNLFRLMYGNYFSFNYYMIYIYKINNGLIIIIISNIIINIDKKFILG